MGDAGAKITLEKEISQTLEIRDQLSVVLKEYDSIRKQIDQGSAFMQSLVIPISVALAGALIGWQAKITPEFAVLALPVLLMCALAAAQHGEAYTEYSGLLLAAVENRVFEISGLPLLCHETQLALKRKKAGGKGWWLAVIVIIASYTVCEILLYKAVGEVALPGRYVSAKMKVIALIGATVPAIYGIVMSGRFQLSRRKWSLTPLAHHIEEMG